ncbi:MAG TPA: glycosyltransferase family 2 protein [Gemmatales bacterium]|nr:glycosyltransferase family 2 protein [Gemmatales bacterium]HMP59026.1 glycosyltransferase family 2 protein [Gemmatales bacterium]
MKTLTAIPVYNEARYLDAVLAEVRKFSSEILVVNDGSTDETPSLLARHRDLHLVVHRQNRGYGAAIRSAFAFAQAHHYDVLVTMDCDGQHEPARISVLLEALGADVDLVSGSRYLRTFRHDSAPPPDRQRINNLVTGELNRRLGLQLTDAFCGFKAYRVRRLAQLELHEDGWGMPLELWVQAAHAGWSIREVGVPLLYLDPSRAFGGVLNDAEERLRYYRGIIDRESARLSASHASTSKASEACY